MVNAVHEWLSQCYSHVQRPDRQILLHPVTDGPTVTRKGFACKSRWAMTRREYKSRMTAKYNGNPPIFDGVLE